MSESSPLLRVEAAEVVVGDQRIVHNVSLTVESGRIVSLIGPNGSGKTTLVRAALGLQPLTAGTVWRRPKLRIGYVPQRVAIDPSLPLTVRRFVGAGTFVSSAAIDQALSDMAVLRLADRPVQKVSGGELQRILIARALLRDPELLVLDEPAQGVDVAGQEELYRLIGDLRTTRGCGILVVSHDLHLVMAETDHVICLNGHICCEGQPASVADHPAYLELFGSRHSDALAVYTHHHDHQHGPTGHLVAGEAPDEGKSGAGTDAAAATGTGEGSSRDG